MSPHLPYQYGNVRRQGGNGNGGPPPPPPPSSCPGMGYYSSQFSGCFLSYFITLITRQSFNQQATSANADTTDSFADSLLLQMQQEDAHQAAGSLQSPLPSPTASTDFHQPEQVHTRQDLNVQHEHGGPESQHAQGQPQPQRRIPIPPLRNPSQHTQPNTSGGPMSRNISVPPRPRPGRKPIPIEETSDKRRAQNRIAQRNFRDKRQQKLAEALRELDANKRQYEEELSDLSVKEDVQWRKVAALTEERDRCREERDRYRQQTEQMQLTIQRLQLLLQGRNNLQHPGSVPMLSHINTDQRPVGLYSAGSVPTPPEDVPFPHEIDFTAQYARSGSGQQHQFSHALTPTGSNVSASSMNFGDMRMSASDNRCGFCTDDQNCSCKADKAADDSSANITVPGPGTCVDCRRNPIKANMCRELALTTHMAARPSAADRPQLYDGGAAGLAAISNVSSLPAARMSCSQLLDAVEMTGEHASSVAEMFAGQLNAYPLVEGGYEVEQQEAAQVLQSLSRRTAVGSLPLSNERAEYRRGL